MSNSPVIFDFGPYHPLDSIFSPKSVAVIGASEKPDSIGTLALRNLIDGGYTGKIYPINLHYHTLAGLHCYKKLNEIAGEVEMAMIATPAPTVPNLIRECVEKGVKGAVILSAGFIERGAEGAEYERQVFERAKGKLRIIGPNSLGVMRSASNLNASFAANKVKPGRVAFISQSGAFCNAVLDWSVQENVGFSHFISVGSMLDVGWGELIGYLGDDGQTKSILIYMETIDNVREFLSAARETALSKPIIVIKGGRTQAAAQASLSHTGILAGSDEVLDAAFRRVGVLRVNKIAELFYMAELLGKQPRPNGKRLTIVTNAGGPAVLATDALIADGGELASLSPELLDQLDQVLPPYWSRQNPLDIIGDADTARYAKTIEIAAKNPNSDGMLVILTPQFSTDPLKTAQWLVDFSKTYRKPLLASWMGGRIVQAGTELLNTSNVATFLYPDTAVQLFNYMWRYDYTLRSIYETPMLDEKSEVEELKSDKVKAIIDTVHQNQRTILTEVESKQVLRIYALPVDETVVADNADEAVGIADKMGYPVAVKLYSYEITHKREVGGVKLNVHSADEVRQAYQEIERAVTAKAGADKFEGVTVQPMFTTEGYEVIIGSKIDPQFGQVLLFGAGGQLVEVYKDFAVGLPPLTSTLARRMMERTAIYNNALIQLPEKTLIELEQILVRFSYLVAEQNWIQEIDINPLLVTPEGITALDARMILHSSSTPEDALPKLAIQPYPKQYVQEWQLKDGTPVLIRPIRAEDEPTVRAFHETLSDRSVYFRYLHPLKLSQRVSHERLTRICFLDYDREMALVVVKEDPDTGVEQILGIGRLTKIRGTNEAEFALLISDAMQGQGIGSELLRRIIQIGRDFKLEQIVGDMHPENMAVQHVAKKLGFKTKYSIEDQLVKATLELK
jgi:acetyltransferase